MSARYDRLGPRFFGADLECGEMDLHEGHTVTCFLIVDRIHDEVFVKKQVLQLLVANSGLFHIFGKKEPFWHSVIDGMNALHYPCSGCEVSAMTAGYDTIDDFVNELYICIHARTLLPNDIFLLYDDAGHNCNISLDNFGRFCLTCLLFVA